MSGIVPDNSVQANLFEESLYAKEKELMDMIDNVNFSMRDDIIKFARSGTKRDWKMRQELRSLRNRTRWDELYNLK